MLLPAYGTCSLHPWEWVAVVVTFGWCGWVSKVSIENMELIKCDAQLFQLLLHDIIQLKECSGLVFFSHNKVVDTLFINKKGTPL